MFGIGVPEVLIIPLIVFTIFYALLMFLLPFFVYTIRTQSIRTNELLEKIVKTTSGENQQDSPPENKPVAGPVTCEICQAQIEIKDYVPHVSKCMQDRG